MSLKRPYSIFQIKPKNKSELSINLKKLREETLANLKHSKANNTIRAYKSDFKDLISALASISSSFSAVLSPSAFFSAESFASSAF